MITQSVFVRSVIEGFRFLTETFGYVKDPDAGRFCVGFRKSNVQIDVVLDHARSYELGILVSEQQQTAPAYELAEVLRFGGCPERLVSEVQLIQAIEPDALRRALGHCAVLLQRYGGEILQTEVNCFPALASSRAEMAAAYTKAVALDAVANAAESAWGLKDYGSVVRILKPHQSCLNEVMLRRLNFAENRLKT